MSSHPSTLDGSRRGYVPILRRVAGLNAGLLIVAVVVTILVLDPTRVPGFRIDEEGAFVVIVLAMAVALNVVLLRRIVGPVQRLTELSRRVDLTGPAVRMPVTDARSEAGELTRTFNDMLDRLEAERRDATGRVLAGQEAERLRIAQELHDQIGQELTAVLLRLSRVHRRAGDDLKADVTEVQDAVRHSLEGVRQIAVELRPEALDDLGLESALAVLCERFAANTAIRIGERIDPDLPALPPDVELVVYRVAQEALTNVARHSGANSADLELAVHHTTLTMTVTDHGRGLGADHVAGTGMRGMTERAALIGADLTVSPASANGGCRVQLTLDPIRAA